MCGRYTLATPDPAAIRERFPIGEQIEVRQRFNVAPGDDVLAVTTDREGAHVASCCAGVWSRPGPRARTRA